jgi:hypothetical protein
VTGLNRPLPTRPQHIGAVFRTGARSYEVELSYGCEADFLFVREDSVVDWYLVDEFLLVTAACTIPLHKARIHR